MPNFSFAAPIALFASISAAAQKAPSSHVIHGRVVTAARGTPVADAQVFSPENSRIAIATGSNGSFTLRLPAASTKLVAARMGYQPETLTVNVADTAMVFRLVEAPIALNPVVVQAEQSLTAASSMVVRQFDIQLRPRESSQELLRIVPGLVIAQHAGGGKAEQIFLRGFDADHGTDVAISVDGTPVNMVSHAHGQGYADLHFLMPEVIEQADVRKGPFDVRDGDFATGGAVAFRTKDRLDHTVISARTGSFDTEHGVVLLPFGGDAAHAGGYFAGSAHYTNGPFDRAQDYKRFNGFAKFTAPVGTNTQFVASASGFGGRWNASGEIPSRAVADGLIDRFGTIDTVEGGNTQRYDVSASLRSMQHGRDEWEARAYAIRYQFQLYSDFTFFLDDPVNGDAIEQYDNRTVTGGSAYFGRALPLFGQDGGWRIGATARHDDGDVVLYHQHQRVRLDTKTNIHLNQTSLSTWAQYDVSLSPRLRMDVGVRADLYRFGVTDKLNISEAPDADHPDGSRWQGIVSPKLNFAFDATKSTTLFANFGSGFHSNDARDVVLAPSGTTILPRATGAELGVRQTWNGATVAASLWALDLQSELVWAGDEGTTEASSRTRRIGVDLEGRVRIVSKLWADADVNLARGRFRDEPDGANLIPLAPTVTSSAGLTVRDAGPWEGGTRLRLVSARAANEDDSVRALGYTVFELFASRELGPFRLVGAVDNLFNTKWNEAQFATTSQLRGEAAPVTELNFTPGSPRSIQFGIEYRFDKN